MNLLEQMGIRFPLKEKDFASHVLSPKKAQCRLRSLWERSCSFGEHKRAATHCLSWALIFLGIL